MLADTSVVAYAVTFYQGAIAPWKLLYLILGALAITCGVVLVIYLPDSPVNAKFLSEEERIAALERVRLDQAGTNNKHIKRYQVVETFKDIRTWIMFLIIMCIGVPNGGNVCQRSVRPNVLTLALTCRYSPPSPPSSPRHSAGRLANPSSWSCHAPQSAASPSSSSAGCLTGYTIV